MFKIKILENENKLLNEVSIQNSSTNLESSIFPNLGASLQKLSINGIEIIDGITNNEEGLKVYNNKFNASLLFPFPNRIDDGKYNFNTTTYQLYCNEATLNNALHGHIFNKTFEIVKTEASENYAKIVLNYTNNGTITGFPFAYKFEVTYVFYVNKVTIEMQVKNIDIKPFPFGLGWHPYFKSDNLATSVLNFEGNKKYDLDVKMIPKNKINLPFKTPLTINDTFLDDCFLINKPQVTFNTTNYNVQLDFISNTPESFLQCYTPHTRDSIAIEPMTCAPNSFNNLHGLKTLNPDEHYNWQITMHFDIL